MKMHYFTGLLAFISCVSMVSATTFANTLDAAAPGEVVTIPNETNHPFDDEGVVEMDQDAADVSLTTVPEPTAAILIGLSGFALMLRRRY